MRHGCQGGVIYSDGSVSDKDVIYGVVYDSVTTYAMHLSYTSSSRDSFHPSCKALDPSPPPTICFAYCFARTCCSCRASAPSDNAASGNM